MIKVQIEHDGLTQSATAWAREIGISYHLLRWRLRHWPIEQALTTSKRAHSKQMTYDGRTQNIKAWARDLGITPKALADRLQRGEPIETALSYRRKTRTG
jgi:hypothetical protein